MNGEGSSASARGFELADEDLLGYEPGDLSCVQCGGVFCGCRTGRIYKGKPLIMCTRKEAVREVLAHLARRGGDPR